MRLIGTSPVFLELLDRVRRVSPTDAPVLLAGEPGTGKDAIARRIHEGSRRRRGRFVVLDCRAIPGGLVESELFGHDAGAFSGATSPQVGRLETAHGGTLYLDGVDELPRGHQVRFLRAVESGEYLPLGSSIPRRSDFRLIAAASGDLMKEVRAGRFREDLYYRLKVVELALPPLRERSEDIIPLADALLAELARAYAKPARRYSEAAKEVLREYSWPGNIHDLRNAVEAALASARGQTIEESDLPLRIRAPLPDASAPSPERTATESAKVLAPSFQERVRDFQRSLLLEALGSHGWDLRRAAAALGMQRHQLKYLCAKLEIRRPRFDEARRVLEAGPRPERLR